MASDKKKPPARVKVESTFADKWEPQNDGDTLEGTYIGTEMANGKRDEKFRVFHIQDESDKRWSVSGSYLESKMRQIPRGTYVWITYTGTRKVNNGDMFLFDVDVAEGTQLLDIYDAETPHPADG
jgi:hypothetical protein